MSKSQDARRNKPITVRVDELSYQRIASIAEQKDVSVAWVIRRALEKYLENDDRG